MDKALLEYLCLQYGWNDPVINPVNSGLINNTWKVSTDTGEYVLQSVNTNVFAHPEAIDENLQYISVFLKETSPDYLFTAPVAGREGKGLVYAGGQAYRVFDWIPGSHTLHVLNTPNQAQEAALAFGNFTRVLSDFKAAGLHASLPGFHDLAMRYRQFEDAATNGNHQRIQEGRELIRFLLSQKEIVNRYEQFIHHPSARLRVTHHDTKISNVLFDVNDRALCVIDLDTVMPGFFVSDVGDMFRTYVCPVSEEEPDLDKITIRKEYIDAISKGYLSVMKDELSAFEKDHFFFAGEMLMYMQALRFMTDHLQNDTYYGARYPNHNQSRAANQARLLMIFQNSI